MYDETGKYIPAIINGIGGRKAGGLLYIHNHFLLNDFNKSNYTLAIDC